MIKNTYKLLSLILICSLLFTSCRQHHSAADVALDYYNLITRQDASDLISLGMPSSTADDIISQMHTSLHDQINEQLSMNGQIAISEENSEAVLNAYLACLKKVSAHASDEKTESGYTVTLTSTYVDYPAIDQTAIDQALKKIDASSYADEQEYLKELTDAYISALINGFNEAEPSKETITKTYPFTDQMGLYLPEDYEDFTTGIFLMVTHQD